MQIVAVDILGPLPKTKDGNAYVLVASDYFTRWVEAYAIPNQEAVTVAQKLVDELFCRFSTPEQLHSDQGRQFESDLIAEVCRILKIHKTRTTPYHPQGDGLVERFNRTLLDMLATMTKEQPGDWDGHIRRVCLAYNSSIQATTGYTPFFLMFGREARLPLDLMYHSCTPETVTHSEYATRMKDSIEKAYDRVRTKFGQEQRAQKQFYDQKCHGKPYTPGDLVWLHSTVVARGKSRKLHHPWTGPWKVLKRIADTTYRLQDCRNPRKKLVVHFDRLKRCTEDTRMEQPQAAIREERHKPWKRSKPVRRVTGPNERITLLDGDDDTPPLTPEVEEVLPPDRIDAPPDPARPINDGGGAPDPEAPVLEPHADGHRTIIGDPLVARRYPARARPPPGFYQESHI
jgi:transposase InsO family protein